LPAPSINIHFVVICTSRDQDAPERGVSGQNYNAASGCLDAGFRVNTTVTKDQWQSSVGTLVGGNFAVAWTSTDQDGSLDGGNGQRFSLDR
jgi:hypothetical protein